jgi:hypothetical protein
MNRAPRIAKVASFCAGMITASIAYADTPQRCAESIASDLALTVYSTVGFHDPEQLSGLSTGVHLACKEASDAQVESAIVWAIKRLCVNDWPCRK